MTMIAYAFLQHRHLTQVGRHPLFLAQLERPAASVEAERAKNPARYKSGANVKVLANIVELALQRIPQDPTLPRSSGRLARQSLQALVSRKILQRAVSPVLPL